MAVHFRSSSWFPPDAIFVAPFPWTLTTGALDPSSSKVVWDLLLQADPEGPSLISRAARLLLGGLFGLLSAPSWRTVVRIAGEAVAASLKLPVQVVEQDIAEQW